MKIMLDIFLLFTLHVIADYFLQIDFIANTKGDVFYHMLVHCATYTAPFMYFFGLDYRILILFVSHIIIDELKCHKYIDYFVDQSLHIMILLALYRI